MLLPACSEATRQRGYPPLAPCAPPSRSPATSRAGGCPRAVVTASRRLLARVPSCRLCLAIGLDSATTRLSALNKDTIHGSGGKFSRSWSCVCATGELAAGLSIQAGVSTSRLLLDPNSALVFFNLHRARPSFDSNRIDCANFFTIHEKDPHDTSSQEESWE